jgi:hypothetical protein
MEVHRTTRFFYVEFFWKEVKSLWRKENDMARHYAGWVPVERILSVSQEHPLFDDNFIYGFYIKLISTASWRDGEKTGRHEILTSYAEIAKVCSCDRSKARRILKKLHDNQYINMASEKRHLKITCEYLKRTESDMFCDQKVTRLEDDSTSENNKEKNESKNKDRHDKRTKDDTKKNLENNLRDQKAAPLVESYPPRIQNFFHTTTASDETGIVDDPSGSGGMKKNIDSSPFKEHIADNLFEIGIRGGHQAIMDKCNSEDISESMVSIVAIEIKGRMSNGQHIKSPFNYLLSEISRRSEKKKEKERLKGSSPAKTENPLFD